MKKLVVPLSLTPLLAGLVLAYVNSAPLAVPPYPAPFARTAQALPWTAVRAAQMPTGSLH
jgi:hypothetical protein